MRVIVCGGRHFKDKTVIRNKLSEIHGQQPISCVIHGDCYGVDKIAQHWAKYIARIPEQAFAADWNGQGLSAGPRRNYIMLKDGKPDLVIAFPGGKGTENMKRQARRYGITVIEILGEQNDDD